MGMLANSMVLRLGTASLLAVSLSACAHKLNVDPGLVPSQADAALGQGDYSVDTAETYVLRPSDVISVTVFREPELSMEALTISGDGMVSLPLVGPLDVAGMSAAEVEDRVEQLLGARYLREPQVAVNVVSYNSHQVTVDGAVATAGVYDFRPGTRLSGGISLAGGPDRVADTRQVAVFRETPEGMAVAKFDYQDIRTGRMMDPVLQPGDRIVVGTDGLSQFWQDFLRSIPVFALFTRF